MAITNLNSQLWIRIYNGFDKIPDLTQTDITKKPGHFRANIFPANFSLSLLNPFVYEYTTASILSISTDVREISYYTHGWIQTVASGQIPEDFRPGQ